MNEKKRPLRFRKVRRIRGMKRTSMTFRRSHPEREFCEHSPNVLRKITLGMVDLDKTPQLVVPKGEESPPEGLRCWLTEEDRRIMRLHPNW